MYYDKLKSQVKRTAAARQQQREARELLEGIDIYQHIAPVYGDLHRDIEARAHTFINLPGGRGSCKSSFVSLEIVNGIMQDTTGESNAIVFRRTGATLRESVFAQIAWAVDVLEVNHLWRGSVSPMKFVYLPTGQEIVFRGLDDSSKLKSIKPRRGVFRFIWFEEFSELPGPNFTRSVLQSVMRGGNDFICFRSFNPPQSRNNWSNMFILEPDPRAVTLHTSYLDVPPEWLGESFITEADRLKEINPTAYKHEYLGEATGSGGEVFPNVEAREITEDDINALDYFFAGIDWGFSTDPAVFLRVAYNKRTDSVFFLDEIYRRHMSNRELADAIKANGYHLAAGGERYYTSYGVEYGPERQLIICDAAEPKSINDVCGEGLRAIACHKYPGSVLYGVKWLQHRRLVIDPKRTPNTYREFVSYEYLQDKDGNFLADVPDKDNHTIDAARYALDRAINYKGVPA